MTEEDVEWLAGEIRELLNVGQVGLYEFLWTLRSRRTGESRSQMREIARGSLALLRRTDDVVLISLVWPGFDVVRWPSWEELTDDAWNDVTEEPYYAIVRPDELDEEPPARSEHQ